MKRLTVLAMLAATFFGVAACNSTTTGQPGAATAQGDGPTSTNAPATSTSAGGGQALPADHPCSLLSSSDITSLGLSSQPDEEMVGSAHVCHFRSSDFSTGVAVRTNVGLSGYQPTGGTAQPVTVGHHSAEQAVDNTGSCTVAIGVTDSSRVDVVVTPVLGGDPCPTAVKIANMIEPKLP